MTGGWGKVALEHVGKNRGHQRIVKPAGNLLGSMLDDKIMFAEHHVWPVLFRAARREEDGGFAALQCVSHFGPRQFFHKNAFRNHRRERQGS